MTEKYGGRPRLSVVIPCYNERETIEELVDAVIAAPVEPKEIIIVDDCSVDGTRDILEERLRSKVHKIVFHEHNMGKGAALKSGFAAATGAVVIIQDADLEYNPSEYPRLVEPLEEGIADVVYGSRFVTGERRRVLYFWHFLGNQFLTLFSNMMTNLNLSDMETCYKAFRREIVEAIDIEEKRFGVEPEITAKVARMRCRVYEVSISYSGRTYEEGKKIGWRDGVRAIWCILKYNLRRS